MQITTINKVHIPYKGGTWPMRQAATFVNLFKKRFSKSTFDHAIRVSTAIGTPRSILYIS